jgi:hypothetical protein
MVNEGKSNVFWFIDVNGTTTVLFSFSENLLWLLVIECEEGMVYYFKNIKFLK